jgi:cell division protease FtsH
MSPRLGRVRLLRERREVFLGRDYLQTREISQPTLEHLDAEVRRIVEEQEARARAILLANGQVVTALAQALATEETLRGEPLTGLLRRVALESPPGSTNSHGAPTPPPTPSPQPYPG